MFWTTLFVFASTALSQFVSEPNGFTTKTGYAGIPVRFKEVPAGTCELDPKVKSYSGYADVDENQHIFFWFFEAREVDPLKAPLTVWISGGPGASSINELFQHLGPCFVDYSGNVYNNPHSWSTFSNILFIDQPNQVGFSYSIPVPAFQNEDEEIVPLPNNTCPPDKTCETWSLPDKTLTANSTENAAPNMWKTLQGFLGAFPQYTGNGLHLTSESYGGHYGPVFSRYFEGQNDAKIPGTTKIELQSLMIGNGWYVHLFLTCPRTYPSRFEPIVQNIAYYNFTVSPGNTYNYSPFNNSYAKEMHDSLYQKGGCIDALKDCAETEDNKICADADEYCGDNVDGRWAITNRDETEIRELNPDPFPYSFYVDYLNTAKVQQAIGAYTNFSTTSQILDKTFKSTGDDARESNTIEDIRYLLARGVTVNLHFGDADYSCNWYGGEAVAELIGADGWDDAGYVNVATNDGIVHGEVKQAGNFSFTRVYYAGHEAPFYQPVLLLEMLQRVVSGKDVATGKVALDGCYRTQGLKESTFREGNSTMQWERVYKNTTYDLGTNAPGAPWPGAHPEPDNNEDNEEE